MFGNYWSLVKTTPELLLLASHCKIIVEKQLFICLLLFLQTLYVGICGFYLPLIISFSASIYSVNILKKKVHDRLFYVSKLNPIINQNAGSIISNEKNLSSNQDHSHNNNNNNTMINISPMYLKRIWSGSVIFETNHIFKVHQQAKKELPLLLGLVVLFIISRAIFFIYFGVSPILILSRCRIVKDLISCCVD